jgi:hypothetical protein
MLTHCLQLTHVGGRCSCGTWQVWGAEAFSQRNYLFHLQHLPRRGRADEERGKVRPIINPTEHDRRK